MVLTYFAYSLILKHPFSIAVNSRTETPVIFVEIFSEGFIGFGEASLPPYLIENQNTVIEFLKKVDFSSYSLSEELSVILDYVNDISSENYAAKSALDIALHDLWGKKQGLPLYKMVQSRPEYMPPTSCTLGMASEPLMLQKIIEAHSFLVLKVKLGGDKDKQIINWIRKQTNKPLYIDANQGWKNKYHALEMIKWLSEQGAVFIEQPLPKERLQEQAWLLQQSSLPILADEACQTVKDLEGLEELYSGINIKLMKSGGIREAKKMISLAREQKLSVMMGCMNESSCAVMAAAALAPLCDYVDLDGPFLIDNNPFDDPILQKGKIILSDLPGLGLSKKKGFIYRSIS